MNGVKSLAIAFFALLGTVLFAGEVSIKTNMTCESCKSKISETLERTEGINEYNVDLAENIVTVKYDDSKLDEAAVTKTIADLGFSADKAEASTGDKKACGTKKCCSTKKEAKK